MSPIVDNDYRLPGNPSPRAGQWTVSSPIPAPHENRPEEEGEVWCNRCPEPATETYNEERLCHACALDLAYKIESPSWRIRPHRIRDLKPKP